MAEITETTTVTTPDPYNGLSRQQFINEEKAKQLDKGVDYLAAKNAELQADLNAARARIPGDDRVVLSKEDAAALSAYRAEFPTPKEAKDARANLGSLRERDEQRSYDDARRAALDEYTDLPDGFKALIPTAEELALRPGGKEQLKNVDAMKAEVAKVATAYGAVKQDQRENTDVTGPSPAGVSAGGDKGKTVEAETKEAVSSYYSRINPNLAAMQARKD